MRSVKNDILLSTILKSEIRRIPYWLRITKAKLVIASLIEVTVVVMIISTFMPVSEAFAIDHRALYVLFPLALLAPFWFYKAYRRESMAYQNATYIASIKKARKEAAIVRAYGGFCEAGTTLSPFPIKPAAYCPTCGLVMVPVERRCRTCCPQKQAV